MISFRDPLMSEFEYSGEEEHGSAFERISAFQFGFTDGASACAAIDLKEIGQRRGDLPVMLPEDQTGEWPVTEESVRAIVDAMGILFSPANPPQLSFDASSASDCPDARPSPPASYCPATNTIVVDLPELEVMGAQSQARTAAVCCPATTPPTRCWSPGTCRPSSMSAAACPRQRRGGAAHCLPDRRGHDQDVEGSQHSRRQHHRADRR